MLFSCSYNIIRICIARTNLSWIISRIRKTSIYHIKSIWHQPNYQISYHEQKCLLATSVWQLKPMVLRICFGGNLKLSLFFPFILNILSCISNPPANVYPDPPHYTDDSLPALLDWIFNETREKYFTLYIVKRYIIKSQDQKKV